VYAIVCKTGRDLVPFGNHVFNILGGKEFKVGSKAYMGGDLRVVKAGNRRYVPIDVTATQNTGTIEYDMTRAYEKRYADYFRMDLRGYFRLQGKRVSQEWSLDLQNITNYPNVQRESYSFITNERYLAYQLGFWPMFKYRLLF